MLRLHSSFHLRLIFVFSLFLLCSNSTAGEGYDEKVLLEFDGREWVADFAHANDEQQVVEYVLKGESVDNWSELLTIGSFAVVPTTESFEFFQNYYSEKSKKDYPNIDWNELYRDEKKVLNEFTMQSSGRFGKVEHTINMFVMGDELLHLVLYACRDEAEFLKRRESWIESFKNSIILTPEVLEKGSDYGFLSNSASMIHIQYRYVSPLFDKNAFISKPKKVWRSSLKYMRAEESVDPEQNLQSLLIVDEPNFWMVNLYDRSGFTGVDEASTLNTVATVFGEVKKNGLSMLELGNEQKFFEHYGARQVKDEIIDSHDCMVYELNRVYWVLKMYVRKDTNLPYLISRKSPDKSVVSVYYDKYEINLEIDKSLFIKPENINWK